MGEDVPILHVVGQEGGQPVQGDGLGPGESERYGHVDQLEVFEGLVLPKEIYKSCNWNDHWAFELEPR